MRTLQRPGVLPEALLLPVEEWAKHPRFPQQTLLLNSHESFRRTGSMLLERARAGRDGPGIGWVFHVWKSAMRNHEAYEEYKLYPYLEARWGLSMEEAEQGHRALGELDAAVRAAISPGDATEALADALAHHRRVLGDNLINGRHPEHRVRQRACGGRTTDQQKKK